MYHAVGMLSVALLALATGAPGDDNKPSQEQPKVVKDTVKGSIHHGSGGSWDRIVGKVKVIDARTLEFADGTRKTLDMVAPELGQQGKIDGKLYPAGKEAAEFLRERIGDRPVALFYREGNTRPYVGDENLEHTMVINGWALADHSSLHAAEIIARENKRGLWRGEFVDPDEWRKGKRLPGEK
ncbi:MAG: thermonuclease family protein [Pirellulaceae bacterium]